MWQLVRVQELEMVDGHNQPDHMHCSTEHENDVRMATVCQII
jgi:hypothetical protein